MGYQKVGKIPSDIKMSNAEGGDVELTIEETNKLREKLGLKPLQGKKDEIVHVDPRTIKKAQTAQEKFDAEVERKAKKAGNAAGLAKSITKGARGGFNDQNFTKIVEKMKI